MNEKIDPELVDDRDSQDPHDAAPVVLPEYNPEDFELPDDYEHVEEGEENDGEE